ncbi:hypothetical protein IMSAGC009_04246 [Lachnospiraceae bacterium]|nr:hypothetical protein IMSAGC009_04246 [Lachnospiraceae bacterium]
MSTIALKGKNYAANRKEHGIFKEIVKAYREYQAEIVCGLLAQSGNVTEATKLYLMMKK